MYKKLITKKHLITFSLMMALVVISVLNIYSKIPVITAKKSTKFNPVLSLGESKFIIKDVAIEDDYSFANEALPINDAIVRRKMKYFLRNLNFKHVQSNVLQNKAIKIFPIIVPILRAHGIPDDFKYLPLVESGLSGGTSLKGARGLWQFMPGTARNYGLKVRDGIDERMNIHKSTIAACKYIKELYAEFHSWTLAAAAYNNGEIKLAKAINRQNEDNYFLLHLNCETAAYVYDLVAMKQIITRPEKYGYKNYYSVFKPSELLAFN